MDGLVRILVAPLSILPRLIKQLQHSVGSNHLEADIDIQENTLLLHDQARVEARPHFDVVSIKGVCVGLIKGLLADLFKP